MVIFSKQNRRLNNRQDVCPTMKAAASNVCLCPWMEAGQFPTAIHVQKLQHFTGKSRGGNKPLSQCQAKSQYIDSMFCLHPLF